MLLVYAKTRSGIAQAMKQRLNGRSIRAHLKCAVSPPIHTFRRHACPPGFDRSMDVVWIYRICLSVSSRADARINVICTIRPRYGIAASY